MRGGPDREGGRGHMATTAAPSSATSAALGDSRSARIFHWAIAIVTLGGLALVIESHPPHGSALELGAWVLACLVADLMYVRIGRSITSACRYRSSWRRPSCIRPESPLSLHSSGRWTRVRIRGQSTFERILFNRSQVALSAASASLVIHLVAPGVWDWPLVVAACAAGLVADCIVNVALVVWSTVLSGRARGGKY